MENDDPVEERSEEASNRASAAPAPAQGEERINDNRELLDLLRNEPPSGLAPAVQQEDGDISRDGADGNDIDEETIAWDDSPEIALDASFDDARPWGDESWSDNEDDVRPWADEGDAYPNPWGDEDPTNQDDDVRPWGDENSPDEDDIRPWADDGDAYPDQEEFVPWGDEDLVNQNDVDSDDARAWGGESSPDEDDARPWADDGDQFSDGIDQEALIPWGEENAADPEAADHDDGDSDVSIVDGGMESSSENGMGAHSSNSSENGLDDSDADRLFDDYIQNREQQQSSDAEIYNTELPTEHAYLGKLERVEGVDYLEPGKTYCLPVYSHHSIVFPGEIVPMILNAASLNYEDQSDGVKFGLLFRTTFPNNYIYGVTCQVFERGERDLNGSIILKTVAQQRFHVVRHVPNLRAEVKILPEIILPDPLLSSCSNLMKRHAVSNSKKYSHRFKSFVSHAMTWPKFVYDFYGTEDVLTKVERYLAFLKITSVPNDPVKLSFWLARNIPIDERDRKLIYQADAVISRMLIINKSLDHMCYFLCKRCDNEIGSYNDIFAMNKQGVQTSYCNPAGYVHETLTIYKTKDNSTFTVDRPSTEFSWFPGYSWQITLCSNCRQHLGWKFVATKNNYLPKSFYGLSGNSIKVKSVTEPSTSGRRAADDDDVETDEGDAEDPFERQRQARLRRIQRMDIVEEILNIDGGEYVNDEEDLYQVINFSPENANAAVQVNAPVLVLDGIADEEGRDEEEGEDDEDRFQDARE